MDHLAIMNKRWGLLPKIVDGTKTIESRWYMNKSAPWGKITPDDKIYFKNSPGKVEIVAIVAKVEFFENLNPRKVDKILYKYYKEDGIEKEKLEYYFELFKKKKYCILIFLKNVRKIKPFEINKTGFGSMSAWICVENINSLKI